MTDYGSNDFVLKQISAATGRPLQSQSARMCSIAAGRSIPSTMELWPGLLALAVALNLAELMMRKGKSLFGRE